jgi:hypothetical protein
MEFYGYQGIDLAALKREIPVRVGDAFSGSTRDHIRQAVNRATGRDPTDVAAVCCDENGDRVIFVGLPGFSAESVSYAPEPITKFALSDELVLLYRRLEQALEAAARKGGEAVQEDRSNGYSLVNDPAARRLQREVREYALGSEEELLRVLELSSDASQREAAADALGYARRSSTQVLALVRASCDAHAGVRNNAMRALGDLASSSEEVTKQIPAEFFIDMTKSGIWEDRNKSAFLLVALTRNRDAAVLASLRARALDSLVEMARWRDASHAYPARVLLGRIVGLPEERLQELALQGPVELILSHVDHD